MAVRRRSGRRRNAPRARSRRRNRPRRTTHRARARRNAPRRRHRVRARARRNPRRRLHRAHARRRNSPRAHRRRRNSHRLRARTHRRRNPVRAHRRRRRNAVARHRTRRRNVRHRVHHRRRNPRRSFRRNPFSVKGIAGTVIDGALLGLGGVAGYGAVKALDGLYTFPFGQTMHVPGTTATVGDTLQSTLHATAVTIASAMVLRKVRSGALRKVAGGLAAGAWFSVIIDLARSFTALPSSIQGYLGAYPRMHAYPRLGVTTGSNLIGPGSLGSRAATVQAAHARYGSYPVMGGASF